MFRRMILTALLALLLPLSLKAEATMTDTLVYRYGTYAQWCSPEKLYVHIDRTCYTAGEMLWMRGWLANAAAVSRLPLSRYIIAEVLDSKGNAVCRAKIKERGGGFPGHLELPWTLETGFYTFRAYTLWQLNGKPEYLFHQRIRVIGEEKQKIRTPKGSPDDIHLAFFPESGRYFVGVRSVIAVKSTDRVGRSIDFNGRVIDAEGNAVTLFSTLHDGMGAFEFTPEMEKSYFVETSAGKRFPLPPPASDGAVIRLRYKKENCYISISGYGDGQASLLLRDSEALTPLTNFPLNGHVRTVQIQKNSFRTGINHLLVVNEGGIILAERLFYIYDDNTPVCNVETSRFSAQPRGLVQGSISLTERDGSPLDGNCSVSVVRNLLSDWQQADGIISYMGLSSELSGPVNNPCWYFDESVPAHEREAAMELLMMINGWRFYDLDQIVKPSGGRIVLNYMKELMQTVRGRIRRRLSGKMPKNFNFTLLIPSHKFLTTLNVDQADSYVIDSLDFEENTGFMIKIGCSRVGLEYIPKWDGDILAPPFSYKHAPGYYTDNRITYDISLGSVSSDTLKAAVVIADAGGSDVLSFNATRYSDLAYFKTYTLIEYIQMKKAAFEYDGDYMVNRSARIGGGGLQEEEEDFANSLDDSPRGAVKLLVNGNEEPWWGYDMVRVEDLKSIEISSTPDVIHGGEGGVVAITLNPGVGRNDVERDPSLLYFVPLGHQIPQYFTSPRYDRGDTNMSDSRNTVWWSPSLALENGRAEFAFCNTDLQDFPYFVRIEGMTSNGRPFSRHCTLRPSDE